MKQATKTLAVFVTLLFIKTIAQGQVLQDDFNGSGINSSVWNTSAPFPDSSITESGGFAVFQNRGRLSTVSAMPSMLDIAGRFSLAGNVHDSFQVVTRTDGMSVNQYGGFNNGIEFGFTIQDDFGQKTGNIFMLRNLSADTNYVELARGTFSLALNTFYDFRITDDGNNVALYIGNVTTPLLTGTDSIASGNKLGIYNRESVIGSTMVNLDYITVVPEPSTFALAGLGIVALLGTCCSRRHSS